MDIRRVKRSGLFWLGVGWGMPTEFKFQGKILPEDRFPQEK